MNTRTFRLVMIVLSLLYAAAVAVLSVLDLDQTGLFAIIGAIGLGLCWSIFGLVARRGRA